MNPAVTGGAQDGGMSISALPIATSGMRVAEARLEAASSNIANAQTSGRLDATTAPSPYQPIDVVSKDIGSGGTPAGVTFSYQPRTTPPRPVSSPDSPEADANGMVGMPDVDLGEEMISAMMAKYDFAASARMAKAAGDMEKSAIDILA